MLDPENREEPSQALVLYQINKCLEDWGEEWLVTLEEAKSYRRIRKNPDALTALSDLKNNLGYIKAGLKRKDDSSTAGSQTLFAPEAGTISLDKLVAKSLSVLRVTLGRRWLLSRPSELRDLVKALQWSLEPQPLDGTEAKESHAPCSISKGTNSDSETSFFSAAISSTLSCLSWRKGTSESSTRSEV
jgi:hypothetical protein